MYGGIRINIVRILILTTLIIALSSCIGAAAEHTVAPGGSIQAAVNNASSGDEIIVGPGTYTENIVINKDNLVIRSSGSPANTTIAANNSNAYVITIQDRNSVTIKGFTITGAGTDYAGIYVLRSPNCIIEDNILQNNALGIYLRTSNNNAIRNNIASKNLLTGEGRGFNIEQSNYTTISSNTVSNYRYGIYISGCQVNTLSGNTVNQSSTNGIVLLNTINTKLENNNVNSNANYGIYLSGSGSNSLKNNTVFDSTNGINLVDSSGNTILNNKVSDNAIDSGTHAIFLNISHNNLLQDNTVSKNDYGIAMRYSNNNNLTNNNAHSNNRGIYLTLTSSANTLSDNQADSNVINGIVLENCGNNSLVNNTAKLNTVSGIVLGNANNNNLTGNKASENGRGIYVTSSSSWNILSGNTVNSNTGNGILLENAGSNNNVTSNIANSNTNNGIYLVSSNNGYVLSNTVLGNSKKGINVLTSSRNTLSNNTVSDNTEEGIILSLSVNNALSRNMASNNSYGIYLNSSENNNISGNTVTLSRNYGIYLCARSSGNLIFNNYFNNIANTNVRNAANTWNTTKTAGKSIAGGPYLGGNFWGTPIGTGHSQIKPDADEDGITEEIFYAPNITDRLPLVAVYVPEPVYPVANFTTNVTSGKAPLAVLFTDSSQNATSRIWDINNDGTEDSNETSFVHIYEVPGNYTVNLTVSNQNGTASKTATIYVEEKEEPGGNESVLPVPDFSVNVTSGYAPLTVLFTDCSQNATSRSWDVNNDGIEDSNEPSFSYVYTTAGTYTAKLTVANENGTDTKTTLITVNKVSSGGGGGGGGGGGSPESSRNVETKEISQAFVTNGNAVKFDFPKNATCVVYVSFDAKKTVGKTTTIVEMLKGKSSLVSELPEGEVYKSFNVWVGNSGFATPSNIDNPVLCFKVGKSWIQDKKIDRDSIVLNRYSNKTWEQLPVSLSGEDNSYLYFTAKVPGFSSFAITGKENASSETVAEIPPEDEPDKSEDNMGDTGSEPSQEPEQKKESTGMPGFGVIYGIAGLLAVFLYRRK